MNEHLSDSIEKRLLAVDQQIRRQTARTALVYSVGMVGALCLYLLSVSVLNRVGSLLLLLALSRMIWNVYSAGRAAFEPLANQCQQISASQLAGLNAQIRLLQSAIHNLPFLVGINLFFMGLSPALPPEKKAWLDCFFLFVTVLLFGGCYLVNQHLVRTELLPLRCELEQRLTPETPARKG